jgi:hypothetical protein
MFFHRLTRYRFPRVAILEGSHGDATMSGGATFRRFGLRVSNADTAPLIRPVRWRIGQPRNNVFSYQQSLIERACPMDLWAVIETIPGGDRCPSFGLLRTPNKWAFQNYRVASRLRSKRIVPWCTSIKTRCGLAIWRLRQSSILRSQERTLLRRLANITGMD